MNEPGWEFSQDTREPPTVCDKCRRIFYDHGESGTQFNVSSKGLHLPQHSVPVTALGNRLDFLEKRKERHLLTTNKITSSSNLMFLTGGLLSKY